MLSHWIWFSQRTIRERMKWELVQRFSDPEDIFYADADVLNQIDGLSEEGKSSLLDHDLTEAEKILEQCLRERIGIVTIQDTAYPGRLKNIYDPPVVLFYKGTLPDFDSLPAVGIVGTRHPSVYGTQIARRMGFEIAACGGLVISGLAAGIDGSAMSGALLAKKSTVGVLGCGPDMVFPRSNKGLFADVERYGCILSEYVPGTPPLKWNFPRRNRIISGLSCGLLVVEAPEKSGSLITARLANEQGRDVFVVPGNVDTPGFVGSNRLLRAGAIAVSGGWDVISEYESRFPGKISRVDKVEEPEESRIFSEEKSGTKVAQTPKVPAEPSGSHKKLTQKKIDNDADAPYIDLNDILAGLNPDERIVVSAITKREQLVDEVIGGAELPAGKVLAILTMLELKGKIIRHPGRRVSLREKP